MQPSHTTLATPALANSRSACGLLIRRPAIATPSSPLLDLGWVSRSAPRGRVSLPRQAVDDKELPATR